LPSLSALARAITLRSSPARVIGPELVEAIVKAWLESEFEPERSGAKVERIRAYDRERFRGAH